MADGIAGFGAFAADLAAQGKTLAYLKVHHLIGQGNFVVSYSEVDWAGIPTAVFDIFRLHDGLIVEHWDVLEPIPAPEQANNSGKF